MGRHAVQQPCLREDLGAANVVSKLNDVALKLLRRLEHRPSVVQAAFNFAQFLGKVLGLFVINEVFDFFCVLARYLVDLAQRYLIIVGFLSLCNIWLPRFCTLGFATAELNRRPASE